MGLTLLGRLLRYSRDVWRFRLRNDAALASRQTRRFGKAKTELQLLSLGAERRIKAVGEGLGPPAASPFHYLPVELPAVFAVLFEAAKAKFLLCYNRVCLAKNALAFFACNTRPPRDT